MVQFKTGSISFKNKKLVPKSEDEWVRVENTHPPIVTRAQWDMSREIAASKRKPRKMSDGQRNMYVGILKCADCGSGMRAQLRRYKHTDGSETVAYQFLCGTYSRSGKGACTVHAIAETPLTEMVLANIRADAGLVSADEESVRRELEKHLSRETAAALSCNKQELTALASRVSELERRIIPALYEDRVSGLIPDTVFSGLLEKYEKERLDKSAKADSLREKIAADEQNRSDASAWIGLMKKYANIDTLSAAVLLDLIKQIEIGEAVSVGGKKKREVKIFYRYAGNVNLAALAARGLEAGYGQAV
jgi:hypothetical protein